VYDYNRNNDAFGGTVVTGGYVYRGPDTSLQGKYFFLESRNSPAAADDNYWMFDPANPRGTVMNIDSQLTPNTGSPQFPVSFGEDAFGNLYIAYLISGDVYRIATVQPGDYNADGSVTQADYDVWRASFGVVGRGTRPAADGNGDNVVDAADYILWRKNLATPAGPVQDPGGSLSIPETSTSALLIALVVAANSLFRVRLPRVAV
jgi:hypothetical protein